MNKKEPKLLFKNTTKYNKKNYEEFVQFHNNKYNTSYNVYTIIMSILLIYCVIINIKEKNINFMFLFLAILIVFLGLRIYLPVKRHKRNQKNIANTKIASYTFSFYDLFFKLDKEILYYFKLYRVFETEKYFYLYINPNYAMLISKSGFEIGNVEDFRKFIKKKCFFKYRKQNTRHATR